MRRVLGLILVVLLVCAVSADGVAAKKKQQKIGPYYARVSASGTWQSNWQCMANYTASFSLEVIYRNARLESAGQMDFQVGNVSGAINWNADRLCNGMVQTGACSVGLIPDSSDTPVFFDKVKGGLRVPYELPIMPIGCPSDVGTWGAAPGEVENLQRMDPAALIPAKKIGKKTIVVPFTGSASGSSIGKGFSASMSGTMTFTRKKPLGVLAP